MQTSAHLRFGSTLRAVSPGAMPPADGVPVRCGASGWKGALPLPNLPKPTCAVGLRPAAPVALIGTGPGSGAVPRGRPCQRGIWFRLAREWAGLPDPVCRAARDLQIVSLPACRVGCLSDQLHGPLRGRRPDGQSACLPFDVEACRTGRHAAYLPGCLSARAPVRQSACSCPSPDW